MPTGIYKRTKKMKENMSKARKKFVSLGGDKVDSWKRKMTEIHSGNKYKEGHPASEYNKMMSSITHKGKPKPYNREKRPKKITLCPSCHKKDDRLNRGGKKFGKS